jgi:D-glycero-D-manno-heptose 1,7-bisphosphate phosphatase
MKAEADEAGGEIQAIYYCPHDWDEGCDCRKPAPGMLFQAQRDFSLDLSGTVFVGDDERDALAAERAGCSFARISAEQPLIQWAELFLRNRS